MDILGKLDNGAFVLDRFDLPERDGSYAAEVVFTFKPDSHTPFIVWHRTKEGGALYWGHYHTVAQMDVARDYFEGRRTHYKSLALALAREVEA